MGIHPWVYQMLLACVAGSAARDVAATRPLDIVVLSPADLWALGYVRLLHSGVN